MVFLVFFPNVVAFFFEITNIWKKYRDLILGFFLEILKTTGWYGFSKGLLVVLTVFHQGFVKKIHKKLFYQRDHQNHFPIFFQNSKDDFSASEN
jgi:hypothetical protein